MVWSCACRVARKSILMEDERTFDSCDIGGLFSASGRDEAKFQSSSRAFSAVEDADGADELSIKSRRDEEGAAALEMTRW